jgi:SSS family solute:Na+ symporter
VASPSTSPSTWRNPYLTHRFTPPTPRRVAGIPILIVAFLGDIIVEKYPQCCSLGDYIAWRFGPTLKLFVTLITLFNMCIFLLAEFTTVGALFSSFVGDLNYPIIIVVGVTTFAYTAYGGLLVSIVTDQAQTVITLLIITIVWIYVAVEFRAPLEPGFGDFAELLGPQFYGYSAIFSLPASLVAATVFSEAVWQRVWASADRDALRSGAIIGWAAVTICVFLCGLFGFIACWGGLIDLDTADPNLYLFQVFKREKGAGMATVDSWIAELVLILAIIMNESAIDSLINGVTSTISSQFFRGGNINICRGVAFLVCVPLVALATQNYVILTLFLIGNMLCCCCMAPVVAGLIDHPFFNKRHTESCALFSCVMSIATVCIYGIIERWYISGVDPSARVTALAAVEFAWLGNGYAYDYFLVAVFFPVFWMIFYWTFAALLQSAGLDCVGVSEVLLKVPACRFLFGHYQQDLFESSTKTDETPPWKVMDVDVPPANVNTMPPSMPMQEQAQPMQPMFATHSPRAVVLQQQPQTVLLGGSPPPTVLVGGSPPPMAQMPLQMAPPQRVVLVGGSPQPMMVGSSYPMLQPQLAMAPMQPAPATFVQTIPASQSYVPQGGSFPPMVPGASFPPMAPA